MKEIRLTHGKVALVDDEDFEYLNQFKWCVHRHSGKHPYAARHTPWCDGKRKYILMHREIMNPPINMQVDHKNRDTLDNRRGNLRICTNRENSMNSARYINNACGFKGVILDKSCAKWRARITIGGKKIHLGMFGDLRKAALAYNNAAIKYFGKFARLNEI